MPERSISGDRLAAYAAHLRAEERSPGTIEKYLRDVGGPGRLAGRQGRDEGGGDGMAGRSAGPGPDPIHRQLHAGRRQRLFPFHRRELTRDEYERLLAAAGNSGQRRLELLLETICATGIRVSEVRYLTVEAAARGRAEISLKGKIRTILLPGKLCRKLLKYAGDKRSPPARCSSPEADGACPASRSGRR